MRLALSILALSLSGCASAPGVFLREDANPAPSSSLTIPAALGLAAAVATVNPALSFMLVENTGSMVPFFDSRSILLLEKVDGRALRRNDIAIYTRGKELVCHRAKEVRQDGVYFSGDANRDPDGWIDPARVLYRVAGIIFSDRPGNLSK